VCPARSKLNGHADILATILARKSASMSVSVSVSVSYNPWNSSFIEDKKAEASALEMRILVTVRYELASFYH